MSNSFALTPVFIIGRRMSKWVAAACLAGALGVPGLAAAEGDKSSEERLTEVVAVSLSQAKRLYDLGAVFIDVRSDEEWRLGHIKGAHHVNFRRNFARLKDLEGVDRKTALVFYCSSLECKTGPYASAVSKEWGFKNVFYFQAGYFAWMLEDYPIVINADVTTFAGDTIQIRRAPRQ
ncbi:rhodanese-like domain-containing protein [Gilvimarinus sp. F26214L]|uniref:rhodanese-like domain-containing protein n=1 Tax=Gilvimarinus sp. DZF01 TaxID=3461371 RepID=UPI0040454FFA